jgi:ubiquinone biosynthesis protein Coq4
MAATAYAYTARPTRNPFRYLASVWRLVTKDPDTTTPDAAIVEIAFARSKLGRRFARWEEVADHLKSDPRTAAAMQARRPFGPIRLDELARRPAGSLGRVFFEHCQTRGIDPNLVQIPPDSEVEWMLNHFYQTHDIWHVVTGWGNDLPGEVGLGAFYAAQFGNPAFFGYMMALVLVNVVLRRGDLGEVFEAFSRGYQSGKRTEPLFGTDWEALWDRPIGEVRARFGVDQSSIIGRGILEAA